MEKFKSNSTGEFIILKRENQKCTIQFILTGTTKVVDYYNAMAGKVKDPYFITVYNTGYYGFFDKKPFWKQAKQLWQNMLKRCYCEADSKGYFGKATVCERWKCFANFIEDIPNLANFKEWLKGQDGHSVKYNLDKDLTVLGNTVYCAEACSFVLENENKAAGARNGKPYTKTKRA